MEARGVGGLSGVLRIGTSDFVAALHGQALPEVAQRWRADGQASDSIVALGNERGWLALFRLHDTLRADAPAMIAALRALDVQGVRLTILSGDAPETVVAVAKQLGIATADARGGQTPEAKHAYIRQLQAQGAVVAMIGDGVNDAPVLAQAQVSVAMGSGADLARQSADVVLLGERLAALILAVKLARRTLSIVRQNLLWSFAYNLLAIPLAMTGFVTPWMAGLGMSSSSLLVVLNALRLQKGK